jgi:hypothetical protein
VVHGSGASRNCLALVVRHTIGLKEIIATGSRSSTVSAGLCGRGLTAEQIREPLRRAFRLDQKDDPKIREKYNETMSLFETTEIPATK